MQEKGVSQPLIQLISDINPNCKTNIRVGQLVTAEIPVDRGIRLRFPQPHPINTEKIICMVTSKKSIRSKSEIDWNVVKQVSQVMEIYSML